MHNEVLYVQVETDISFQNENQANAENSANKGVASKTPPNTPDPRNPANPQDIAPGMSKSTMFIMHRNYFH